MNVGLTTVAREEVVWVATSTMRRVYHSRKDCFRRSSPRIPSLRVYLESLGYTECQFCREDER